MKIIKIFVSIVASLIAIVLLIAAFAPSEYALKKDIIINQNKSAVFDYIKLLKNQNNYSPWAERDPDMKKTYQGTDGTVGFISAWQSDNKTVGKGEQEILTIVGGERIDTELRFYEPFEATDSAYMTTESISENETKVVWGFLGKMPYPMNLMLLMMDMDKEIGGDLAKGLTNLKSILESTSE